MGNDVITKFFYKLLIKIFSTLFWKKVIVKSYKIKTLIGLRHTIIIPNGVDFKNSSL